MTPGSCKNTSDAGKLVFERVKIMFYATLKEVTIIFICYLLITNIYGPYCTIIMLMNSFDNLEIDLNQAWIYQVHDRVVSLDRVPELS